MQEDACALLDTLGRFYEEQGIADYERHEADDLHAYYRLRESPHRVVHVRVAADAGSRLFVLARLLDHELMLALREKVGVGNEEAATMTCFSNFGRGVELPYSPELLHEMLAENVPELRKKG